MKIKINCPKCGGANVKISSQGIDPTPLYKCADCSHTHRLFPDLDEGKKQAEFGLDEPETDNLDDLEEIFED